MAPPRRFREEQMDQQGLDEALLAGDLDNLEVLNRLFGGRGVLARRVPPLLARLPPGAPVEVLDVGSGAGDLCRFLVEGVRRLGRPVRLYSADYHPQIQGYARRHCAAYPEIRFLRGDARRLPLRDGAVDLALCTLALHHFLDPDAAAVLAELGRVARRWVVVSDLRRGHVGWAAVWLATRFTTNPLTRYDGPVSVARAFTPEELAALAERAGWPDPRVRRESWFRMSLLWDKENVSARGE